MTMGEKILIVEDDREIRTLLSDFLTENGYEVVTASEGIGAELEKTRRIS